MRIIFFKIMPLNYYRGIEYEEKRPRNGGKYVKDNGNGHESYNFQVIQFLDDRFENGKEYCLGFVETKSTNKKISNQLHIERLGEGINKNDSEAEEVLVIWCATPEGEKNKPVVVGWYKSATIYRRYQNATIYHRPYKNQSYSCIAEASNCVLLPIEERHKEKWRIPIAKNQGYGFGQSLVWYADSGAEEEQKYIHELVKNILEYTGENWIQIDIPIKSKKPLKPLKIDMQAIKRRVESIKKFKNSKSDL